MTRSVILVDNQVFFRDMTRKHIAGIPNAKVIGEASSFKELMGLLDITLVPDIIFTEVNLPDKDGITLVKEVLVKYPTISIIGLSLQNQPDKVKEFLSAGGRGYLLKLSNNREVFKQIFDNPKAEIFYSKSVKRIDKKRGGKATILVVDDFETNTYVVGLTLENAKYKVIKAANGTEGLKAARNPDETIDLIVADYNMPDMNGADMIKQIRQIARYRRVPALILSSDNSEKKKEYAESVGITAWIKKPYKIEHFLKAVEMALK